MNHQTKWIHHKHKKWLLLLTLAFVLLKIPFALAQDQDQDDDLYAAPIKEMAAEKNSQYLQAALPRYVDAVVYPWPTIPHTEKLLKVGSHSKAVLALRERLKSSEDLANDAPQSTHFDKQVADAVRQFQWRHGLKADGIVGDVTLAELNVPPEDRMKQMRLNIQRWEELSGELGDRYILVNIPEFRLHLIDHGEEVLNMKIIVGKPTNQTPEFSSTVTRLVFNPYWNIPSRIVKNEIIPKYMEDHGYLRKNNIRIFNTQEDDAYEISPGDINWGYERENGPDHFFRQDPGPKNALGLVKFEFQNTHNVYLHDTPTKNLFNEDQRAFSHGCIRLENPFTLVNYLTQNDPFLTDEKISTILDERRTRYFRIPKPIPIYITYITAWVDDQKRVHFADDIYHRDEESNGHPFDDTAPDDSNAGV